MFRVVLKNGEIYTPKSVIPIDDGGVEFVCKFLDDVVKIFKYNDIKRFSSL